jgi:DNA repair photolyase
MNDRIQITTDNGNGATVEAQAPVIISASRSTDIPAFYAQWFMNRMKRGYVVWYNPFNRQQMYISFKNTKVIVFWSKNPKPLISYLKELDDRGIHYYFQFTLNDYEKEGFEPNVPPLQERIETFKTLSEQIGKEKVIWRFDPLILTPTLTPRDLLKKIRDVGNQLKGYTNKLVFSFVDIKAYLKVQRNLTKETSFFTKNDVENAELNNNQITEIADGLVKIRERWKSEGWNISLATCAEQIDLEQYGIEHNRCIDGELMKQICSEDTDLMYYLSCGKLPDPSLFPVDIPCKQVNLKDKGQRKICGCVISKDIGMYNTCPHHCVYCYANTAQKTVKENFSLHNIEKESITIHPQDPTSDNLPKTLTTLQ